MNILKKKVINIPEGKNVNIYKAEIEKLYNMKSQHVIEIIGF